jgi:hypothetical protein
MRYLSPEWKDAVWKNFEEIQIAGDESDCGGQSIDYPPCGGCARCMRMQFGYYMMKEEERARVFLRAGFDVAPPIVTLDYWPGFSAGHDSYNCRMSGEREAWFFPWEKVPR